MAVFNIGFVVFPNVTQLDFTGPLQVLGRLPGSQSHIVAKTMEPVTSDSVLRIPPSVSFAQCPQLDMICIPGGFGVGQAMSDPETVDFVRRQGAGAKYVTSVCTGTFILGAAGLLAGRRATSHWAFADLLEGFGAICLRERVVRDGNLFTAGGVTSGIDFGLTIAAEIAGPQIAKAIALGIEYDPAPPFDCGHPDRAPEDVKALVGPPYEAARADYRSRIAEALAAAGDAAPRPRPS
jgi:cyclohexyl-isocyanide hydratase